jgi:hypothetical protein
MKEFETIDEKPEAKKGLEGFTPYIADAQKIETIKELKKYLCEVSAPRYARGMPKASECKRCESQCAYGRRLIELMKEINKKEKKKEETGKPMQAEENADGMLYVKMTPAQCRSAYAFIEEKLVASIVDGADNVTIGWISDMIGAMNAMKEAEW